MVIPLWLDCDTGHDDALALLLAARHPDLHLLGVSTIYGNAPLYHTTYNTRAILKAIGREDVPVYAGASKPFCRAPAAAPDIHGESGLDGTTCLPVPMVEARTDMTAVEAMYHALIKQTKGEAWLVVTGACTNAALLFACHPDIVEHIAGLSIMGGAIGDNFTSAPMGVVQGQGVRFGNWTPYAEFNIYLDPEAAQALFSNAALARKTTLIPLDLTHLFLATPPILSKILGEKPTELRKLFHEILTFFAKTYDEVFGLKEGPPAHDPLAVAVVLGWPGLFDDKGGERWSVEVVTDGEHGSSEVVRGGSSQVGRTVVRKAEGEGVRIPRGLDGEGLWDLIVGCLERAEGKVGLNV